MRGETNAQLVPPGGNSAGKDDRYSFRSRIGNDLAGATGIAFVLCRFYREIHRIKYQAVGRLGDFDVDDLGAGNGELVDIWLQIERIVDRHHGLGQLARGGCKRKSRLGPTASNYEQRYDERATEQGCAAIEQ